MGRIPHGSRGAAWAAGSLLALLVQACGPAQDPATFAHVSIDLPARAEPSAPAASEKAGTDGEQDYHLPPPPFSEGVFPCSDCHEPDLLPVNPRRRELKMAHQDIVLHHAENQRWCLDCHDAQNRDVLHLANGDQVPFEESYRLCGQCHGDKLRDWKAGVHGRRSGYWNGVKQYLLCVSCHNAHSPHFAPIAPMPAPEPPRRTP